MRTTLLALHGFTLNGAVMRTALEGIADQLSRHVDIVCLDAPCSCKPDSVERLYSASRLERQPPPHRCWWDASDDGLTYHGWDQSLALLKASIEQRPRVALLGFSQGAIAAATAAALSSLGQLPPLQFVVLVAGSLPRAPELLSAFERPVSLPSLHVWGGGDKLTGSRAPLLADRFELAQREVITWPGPHVVPTRGEAARGIVDFVARRCTSMK
jgi:pimeloyl-ACP methyl ester carboxylesterase